MTEDQIDQKNRGFIPPENETTVLKEILDTDLNPHSDFNATIDSHLKSDNMSRSSDDHRYYISEPSPFQESWINLTEWNSTKHPGIVQEHAMLSKSYR